ncbi:hypothetical protein KFE25_000537 [Diacronema lutheri]|uniref:Uncharacterized protein n=1 Tax=Diacronema lutheri TaxID=2081491 RepID=A0A8J5XQP6_DIALT|nr:hypothetical protein KFE25_000537 [Diacronema lutheri]
MGEARSIVSVAERLHARRRDTEHQLRELDHAFEAGFGAQLHQNISAVLAKLEADAAMLWRDEQMQIHRALALTERQATRNEGSVAPLGS